MDFISHIQLQRDYWHELFSDNEPLTGEWALLSLQAATGICNYADRMQLPQHTTPSPHPSTAAAVSAVAH